MFQTASGSLEQALDIHPGETLLIRGGTSSVGMLSCQLAKANGLTVISTSRNPDKKQFLLDNRADHVIIDDGNIVDQVKAISPNGIDKVLELIGTKTLKDSLQCIKAKGIVCMTGILGNSWSLEEFSPMYDIPSLGRLTIYAGDVENLSKESLQDFIDKVESDQIKLNIDSIYSLDQVAEAHQYMEDNKAKGKVVVVL